MKDNKTDLRGIPAEALAAALVRPVSAAGQPADREEPIPDSQELPTSIAEWNRLHPNMAHYVLDDLPQSQIDSHLEDLERQAENAPGGRGAGIYQGIAQMLRVRRRTAQQRRRLREAYLRAQESRSVD